MSPAFPLTSIWWLSMSCRPSKIINPSASSRWWRYGHGFIGLSAWLVLLPPTVSWICGQSLKCWIWASTSDALSRSTGQITSCRTSETARSSIPTSRCPMRKMPSIRGSQISRFPWSPPTIWRCRNWFQQNMKCSFPTLSAAVMRIWNRSSYCSSPMVKWLLPMPHRLRASSHSSQTVPYMPIPVRSSSSTIGSWTLWRILSRPPMKNRFLWPTGSGMT